MDFLTRRELNGMKGDKVAFESELEANKFYMQKKLNGKMGEDMLKYLEERPKPNFFLGLKYRYLRWKTIRYWKRKERKIKKGGF